jgi:hypothetical protein
MARFYYKLEAGLAASPYKLTNSRLSRLSLILEEPEFNLKYLRFAF